MRLKVYWQVWKIVAINAWQEVFINRWSSVLFLVGKGLRFAMMLFFLLIVHQNVRNFAGYTTDQVIVFFLTYQLVDLISQILFRGVYLFSDAVRTGEFDFTLIKPLNPLFKSLTGRPDVNDTLFLIPTIGVTLLIISQLQLEISGLSIAWYLLLLLNSLVIATALHIFVLVVGILSTNVDGIIWMYRDLIRLGQFPTTIYPELLRFALLFIVPVGAMITIPAETLMSISPVSRTLGAFAISGAIFTVSLLAWNWSLKRYSSASS